MIGTKSVLAVIPARGGSKGLPRKNILELAGKPMVAWSIEAAQRSNFIDRVVLSSEDEAIIATAKQWGCEVPFVRPVELAGDEAPTSAALLHALDNLGRQYDYLVLLQPTSPLREARDIDQCIEKCHQSEAPACVSVTETDKNPAWMFYLEGQQRLEPVLGTWDFPTRRQDLRPSFVLNGAVYVADTAWFKQNHTFLDRKTIAHPMPKERSLDIDTELDLKLVQAILENQPMTR
ncbi:cytidylyltransferase domain-containing protein [Desulfurivibrio dismutans]|uniref:acylneuraminate cytidylyltransferase family protein n=1 Tax=Desulfurivibrio dismutans TaxID=1398908 RepID=UPI0023DCA935|nr:acylneuraminate cytidylyltransferase family protein [Desulfurivibrio alkaliphilus]MDF1613501.1 acylneuraminate cytidylyltransferase family protein [Desulfurivibrio alkaliphilus]